MYIFAEKCCGFNYVFKFDYREDIINYCRFLRKEFGGENFNWHEKAWRFSHIRVANIIRSRYPETDLDSSLNEALLAEEKKKEEEAKKIDQLNEIKTKTTSNLVIDELKMPLRNYQSVGVEFIEANNGRAIIADQMGIGKTAQALGYIVHNNIKKTLVIVPASVKLVWKKEIKKFTKLKSAFIDSKIKKLTQIESIQFFKEHDIFIVGYDSVTTNKQLLKAIPWDLLVCDEFHYIKNNTAQRTKAVKSLAIDIPKIILLSGTPMLNRPVELFNGLQMIDPKTWNNWFKFTLKYCQGHRGYWGWDASGASNIADLRLKINKYFIRRNKSDVLKELPPKQYTDIPVELDKETMFEYGLAVNSFIEYLKDFKKKTDAEVKRSLAAEKLVRLGALRQITSKGKIHAAIDFIKEVVDAGEKIVVFSVYNEPLEKIKDVLNQDGKIAVILTGQESDAQRESAVESFQNSDKIKVFLGGTKSAGVGLTLTAASNVLFLDYSWVPADHDQAADRIHRIGQEAESINIYQLYSKDTIDETMIQLLNKKRDIFSKLIDGVGMESTQQSLIDEVFDEMASTYGNLTSFE